MIDLENILQPYSQIETINSRDVANFCDIYSNFSHLLDSDYALYGKTKTTDITKENNTYIISGNDAYTGSYIYKFKQRYDIVGIEFECKITSHERGNWSGAILEVDNITNNGTLGGYGEVIVWNLPTNFTENRGFLAEDTDWHSYTWTFANKISGANYINICSNGADPSFRNIKLICEG